MAPPNISFSSRLDGFRDPPLQLSHQKTWYQTFEPLNTITDTSPIIFAIPPCNQFINLSRTRLKIRVKITDAEGGNLVEGDDNQLALVCNPIGAIFKHVKLLIGGTPVTSGNDLYPYKSFTDTLFSATAESASTLHLSGFHLDTADNTEVAGAGHNTGFAKRALMANRSRVMEFSGRPSLDILKQGRNLLDNTRLEFIFYPNDPTFAIQRNAGCNTNAKIKILDAKLILKKEELDPSVQNIIHEKLAEKNWALHYPTTVGKIYNIAAGSFQFSASNIFLGKVPNTLLVFFVRAESFTGTYATNPFWMHPSDLIKEIIITKDGMPLPNLKPSNIELNRGRGLQLTDAYESLLDTLGIAGLVSKGLIFPPSDLANGLFFYGANLHPDTENEDHLSPATTGNIDIQVKYSGALADVYEMIVLGEFDITTEITESRSCIHTFPL